jgi:hypothetical protein
MTKATRNIPPYDATEAEIIAFYAIPEPNSGCHLWLGHINNSGYAHVNRRGKMILGHRLAWTVAKGPIPSGLQVLHRCDVRACVNPDHLFTGTNDHNVADKVAKGRQARGSRLGQSIRNSTAFRATIRRGADNNAAKLTDADALAIQQDRRLLREISTDYGVNITTVSRIRRRVAWKHLEDK